ncbi:MULTISPECIES: hypothetical protein [unclassified Arthrobacter]|uniref:hypothetical protein n=1 Tax=Arthrobacter sp. Bz4 TaxID=2171979 RepID=UPI00138B065B|nr:MULTISPECIES: hypothetical protein [unclassified Arthrobacter]
MHFPSTNTAAHRPAPADVARLGELLDDSVWAFSNCRVDTPGKPVAEVDWLFYNTTRGVFTVSEWKGFTSRVAAVTDTGKPWILLDGTEAANPIEQVSKQLDAVRAVLRSSVRPRFFPLVGTLDLNPQQCVYAPQVGPGVTYERLRYGRVHGTLDQLAASLVESRKVRVPLLVADPAILVELADTLADVFRCTVSRAVRRKLTLQPPRHTPNSTQRIVDIHLQLADLHGELARLMVEQSASHEAAPSPVAETPVPVEVPASRKATAPQQAAKAPKVSEFQVMKTHLDRHLRSVGNEPHAVVHGLTRAWAAALKDPKMERSGAVSHALFGSVATERVKHIGPLKKLLGASVSVWCLEQARAAGLRAEPDPKRSSHLLLSRT